MIPLFLASAAAPIIVSLVIALAAAGASYAISRGARKRHGNAALENTELTNLAVQGSYIPLVIGRRRTGAVILWVGDRQVIHLSRTDEKKHKGVAGAYIGYYANLFFSGETKRTPTGQILYSEAAMHAVCVGPALKIYRIWAGGTLIYPDAVTGYTDPLDSTNYPSGTQVNISAGEFVVYWGETDQPINTELGDADRIGVASRWPHVCYIHWIRFGLETNPAWPQIDYDVECEPYITQISDATSYIQKIHVNGSRSGANIGYGLAQILLESYPHGVGRQLADFDYNAGGGGGGTVVLSRFYTLPTTIYTNGAQTFQGEPAGSPGTTDAGTYDLIHSPPYYDSGMQVDETNWVGIYLVDGYESGHIDQLRVYLRGPSAQQVELYNSTTLGDFYDGSDIYSWAPPTGWGIDTTLSLAYVEFDLSEVTLDEDGDWDLHIYLAVTFDNNPNERLDAAAQVTLTTQDAPPTGSLYELIELMDDESYTGSIIARDGEEASEIIAGMLLDIGAFMTRMCDGRIGFVPLREVSSDDVIVVDQDQVMPPEFEVNLNHGEKFVDRAMFSYADVGRNFRESIVQIDEDGQPAVSGAVRGQAITLYTVIDPEVASFVAERRSQEEFGRGARYNIDLARGWHRVLPGRAISVPGISYRLRVISVRLSDTTDVAQVECLADFYGVTVADYTHPTYTTAGPEVAQPVADVQATFLELPEHAGQRGTVFVVPLWVRGGEQVIDHVVHLSNDGTTYEIEGYAGGHVTGGTLDEALPADSTWVITNGPEFTHLGPVGDIVDYFDDLSTNLASWRAGRQCAVIGSELFYVQKITAVGGTTFRLDGLIRARLDTPKEAHSINAEVYLFSAAEARPISSQKVYPGADLYMKPQPLGVAGILPLASVTAINETVVGKGVVPMVPGGLRVTAPDLLVPAYYAGDDVVFAWNYRSTEFEGTGAGLQPFGSPYGVSAIRGRFQVEVYNTSDALVATYDAGAVTTWTYDNADIQSDLGGEVDFYILLRNTDGSLRSESVRLDVEKL